MANRPLFFRVLHPDEEDPAALSGDRMSTTSSPPDAERNGEPEDALAARLFEGGPPARLQITAGLMSADRPNVAFRAMLVVLAGWTPLLVLTAVQSALYADGSFLSFLTDYGAHGRLLIAAPLLIVAERSCLPRLSVIARYFGESGLVSADDAPRFARAVHSTLRLRDSVKFEIALIAVAAALVVMFAVETPRLYLPAWYRVANGAGMPIAAYWHEFVSTPLLLLLLLGWIWRLILWARFLSLVANLKLRLIAAHPDRAAGLRFLGDSLRSFSAIAFALGAIVAGMVANRVAHSGINLLEFRYVLIGFVVLVAFVFVSPLFAFTGKLVMAWRRGVIEYGALAQSLGRQFERRRLRRAATEEALDANDFSATVDLYSIASNVYGMNVVPFGLRDLASIAIAALLPFLPVVAMAISPEVLFQNLMRLML